MFVDGKVEAEDLFRKFLIFYIGRIVTGKVYGGKIKAGMPLVVLSREGKLIEKGNVFRLVARRGVERINIDEGKALNYRYGAGLYAKNAITVRCM